MPSYGSLLAALAVSTLLCGCSSPKTACPPVGDYDDAFKVRLAGELHQLGEGSAAAQLAEDDAVLRAELRACS